MMRAVEQQKKAVKKVSTSTIISGGRGIPTQVGRKQDDEKQEVSVAL